MNENMLPSRLLNEGGPGLRPRLHSVAFGLLCSGCIWAVQSTSDCTRVEPQRRRGTVPSPGLRLLGFR